MLFSSLNKALLLGGVMVLSACATSAPDLPPVAKAKIASTKSLEANTFNPDALAKEAIHLSKEGFNALDNDERTKLESLYLVSTRSNAEFGIVKNVQTVNRSTAGSNAGSSIGSGIASIAYIDRSFSAGNSYSPWAHLGLMALGAAIGGSANTKPQELYESQYTVALESGELHQLVSGHGSAFVVPNESCMDLIYQKLADGMCWQSADDIRVTYLGGERRSPKIQSTPAAIGGIADELKKLHDLHKEGILTKDEFETQKTKLLAR